PVVNQSQTCASTYWAMTASPVAGWASRPCGNSTQPRNVNRPAPSQESLRSESGRTTLAATTAAGRNRTTDRTRSDPPACGGDANWGGLAACGSIERPGHGECRGVRVLIRSAYPAAGAGVNGRGRVVF